MQRAKPGQHRQGSRVPIPYVVKAKILEWRPQANNALRQLRKQQLQPPVLPDNFASLPPEAKQNFLLSNAMFLQVRLLDIAAHLDPQSAREIAQLAAVAQGIVRTSVELEQLRVDRNALNEKREEKIRFRMKVVNGVPKYRWSGGIAPGSM